GRLSPVGLLPALLAPARARRAGGDPRPPDRLVLRPPGRRPRGHRRLRLALRPRPPAGRPPRPRRRAHHAQLGHLHLRGELRAGRRGLARLLHQPAGDGRARGDRPARAAAPQSEGRGGDRGGGGRGAGARLRPAAVDRADARVLVRPLRARQEAGERGGDAQPRDRDRLPPAARDRLPPLARRAGPRHLHHGGPRARGAARRRRRHHGRAADALRRRGDPDPARDDRPPAVPRARPAVPDRRAHLRRGDAALAPRRLRARLGRARDLRRRRRPRVARGVPQHPVAAARGGDHGARPRRIGRAVRV
ncbi:MAG: Uncharacterized inner membrane protein RarD, partial [uncultured Solirubrobacteraceae bacterium]